MAERYVPIQFDTFQTKMDSMGFNVVPRERMGSAKEWLFERQINEQYAVRVYSSISVHTDETRCSGQDAIRITLFDLNKDRPVKVEKRVNRTKNALTNLHKSAREVWGHAINKDNQCPKCSSILVERKGPRGKFLGCSNFPTCKQTKNIDG